MTVVGEGNAPQKEFVSAKAYLLLPQTVHNDLVLKIGPGRIRRSRTRKHIQTRSALDRACVTGNQERAIALKATKELRARE